MGMSLFVFWIALLLFSFVRDRNLFSPSKVYAIILFTFFGDIFWTEKYPPIVSAIFLILLILNFYLIIAEKQIEIKDHVFFVNNRTKGILVFRVWVLTTIPILAQLFFISKFGGFSLFLTSITGRVQDWQGLGYILILIKMMNILSYVYFIIVLKSQNIYKKDLLFFIIHFILFVILALLSGSRSNLLWNFVFMIAYYNLTVKRITVSKAIVAFIAILLLAMVVGVAREGYKIEDGRIVSGLQVAENIFESSNFNYGLRPLDKILEQESILDPKYGFTYLTAITNLIPRVIWPSKPESGGVIITKEYFKDPFSGYSNYTTGLFPEAIINFGISFGLIAAVLIMGILFWILLIFQKKIQTINHSTSFKEFIKLTGVYPFLNFGINSYTYAEFTTNTISTFFYKIFIFIVIVQIITYNKYSNRFSYKIDKYLPR